MKKKSLKVKDLVEQEKPEWELISESKNDNIDLLFEIYKQDKAKARIIYHQRKLHNQNAYLQTRIVFFKWSNGNFKFAKFVESVGIGKTGIIYKSKKLEEAILYKDKKFYHITSNRIYQLTYNSLNNFVNTYSFDGNRKGNYVYDYLVKDFGWLRNLAESRYGGNISFNTIISKKLFNEKAIFKYIYGFSYPVSKILSVNGYSTKPQLYKLKNSVINIENLKAEMLNSTLFNDTLNMANTLGRKINCSWSLKRLKQEHDKWAKEIIEVILEFEPLEELKISKVYRDFAEFSGYELLLTNHDLISEGKVMSHCVGTYSGKVNSGNCAIFRVEGHTLEVGFCKQYSTDGQRLSVLYGSKLNKMLQMVQCMGFDNVSANNVLKDKINDCIHKFNEKGIEQYDSDSNFRHTTDDFFNNALVEELPF